MVLVCDIEMIHRDFLGQYILASGRSYVRLDQMPSLLVLLRLRLRKVAALDPGIKDLLKLLFSLAVDLLVLEHQGLVHLSELVRALCLQLVAEERMLPCGSLKILHLGQWKLLQLGLQNHCSRVLRSELAVSDILSLIVDGRLLWSKEALRGSWSTSTRMLAEVLGDLVWALDLDEVLAMLVVTDTAGCVLGEHTIEKL